MSSKKKQKELCTARFVVEAEDGRRSREWKLWTYASSRASDEVYLAPRDCGESLKISMHSKGESQLGLGPNMRGQLASIDRHALDRWRDDRNSEKWRIAYSVYFPHSELRTGLTPEPGTIRLPASISGQCTLTLVVIADEKIGSGPLLAALSGTIDFSLVATLPRASGGAVYLLTAEIQNPQEALENAKKLLKTPHKMWELPHAIGTERDFGAYFDVDLQTRQRFAVEIALDQFAVPSAPLVYERFRGTVSPWSGVLLARKPEVCSLLCVEADGTERIYVNQGMRCNHENLFTSAHDVLDAFHDDGPDIGWKQRSDGVWMTGLLTSKLAERQWASDPDRRSTGTPGWTYKGPQEVGKVSDDVEQRIRENTLSEAICITGGHVLYDVSRPQPLMRVGYLDDQLVPREVQYYSGPSTDG